MIALRLSVILMFCSAVLFSCKKDNHQPLSNKRLTQVVTHWYDTIGYTFFKYNEFGKLVQIKKTSNNQPLDTSTCIISYDADNKMTGFTLTYNRISWYSSFKFLHDNAGRIIRKLYPDNVVSNIYSYDNLGRLISDSSYSAAENAYSPHGVFKYDNHNNLVEWQFFFYDYYWRTLYSSRIQQSSHNNRPSSYANLGLTLYSIMYERTEGLSKHNRGSRWNKIYEI